MKDDSWASWAEARLRRDWPTAVEMSIADMEIARWHPNGFVVFRLGEVVDGRFGGSHRLHVWPGGIPRQSLPGHPTIHSHDWELQSLVLQGTYVDVIFEQADIGPDALALLSHIVKYDSEVGDSIRPTEDTMRLSRRESRAVEKGGSHHMDIGVFHETVGPASETVVTYVMMGPRQETGMMLLGREPFAMTSFRRPALSQTEREHIESVLLAIARNGSSTSRG